MLLKTRTCLHVFAVAALVLLLSACSSQGVEPAPATTIAPAAVEGASPTPQVVPTDAAMVEPTDTMSPDELPPVVPVLDEAIVEALKLTGLPIEQTVIYTAESDPDDLLGRPDQYVAKAAWHDTRLPPPATAGAPAVAGGVIEIFEDDKGAERRAQYLQETGKSMPALAEYVYTNGPVLLRLSKQLTPAQAEEYRQAFQGMPLEP